MSVTPWTNEKPRSVAAGRSAARSRRAGRRNSARWAVRTRPAASRRRPGGRGRRSRRAPPRASAQACRAVPKVRARRRVCAAPRASARTASLRRGARLHRCAGEEAPTRRLRAAAEVAAEHRVPGVGDDRAPARRGSARRRARAPEVGVRVSCPPERISVGTFGQRRRGAAGAADASGQDAQIGTRLLAIAVSRVERVEVARAAASAARRALRPSASARLRALPREQRLLARRREEQRVVFFFGGDAFGFRAGRIGTLGTAPRRSGSAAAAGRGRR